MILANNQSEKIEVVGETTSKKATINTAEVIKLQYILTEGLYSDGISATIVELTNNAIDSVVEAGLDPIENPVKVELSNKNGYSITITDNGLGMSKEFFEDSFMCYLTSTKGGNNNTIGFYGIGGKSWSSLKRSVNFTIIQDGIKCKYLCYKGAEGVEHDLIMEESTDEPNGVKFEMNIRDFSEYVQFCGKAKKKLTYYDTVVLIIDGHVYENKVYRNELFQYANYTPYNEIHLCLKDVVYEIDFDKLDMPYFNIPIALRFNLDEGIVPTPSRESILYSNHTINLIKDKIAKVSDWFVNKYNEQTKEFDNIVDAWDYIDSESKKVNITDRVFYVEDLEEFSSIKFIPVTVKDITLIPLKTYKSLRYEMIEEYTTVATDYRGTWKKKHLYNDFANALRNNSVPIIRYDSNLAGKVKTFLREKYDNAVYITKSSSFSLKKYINLLGLEFFIKSAWRDVIKEFQKVQSQVFSKIINETGVEETEEFIEWIIEQKALSRERRQSCDRESTYQGLGKERGQITIGRVKKSDRGGASIVRYVKNIEDLGTEHKLCVYYEKETLDREVRYALFKGFPKIDFIELNKTEIKYVEKKENWITMTEFKKSKPFARLATALEIETLESIIPDNEDIIYEIFPKYQELKEKVTKYYENNSPEQTITKYTIHGSGKKIIMDFARENNIYDTNIWDEVLKFKNLLKDFGFLKYLDIVDFSDMEDDEQKIVKNMAYIILKNKKISCRFVEDYELVEKVPVEVYEEMEQIEEFETA